MDKDKQVKPPEPAATPPKQEAARTEPEKKPEPAASQDKPETSPATAAKDKPEASPAPAVKEATEPKDGAAKPASLDDTIQSAPAPKHLHDTRESPKVVVPEQPPAKDVTGPSGTEVIGGIPPAGQPGQVLDRKATERRWLESKSKDELIELILDLEQKQPGLEVTEKMMKVQLAGPIDTPSDSFKIPDDLSYVRLPVVRKAPANEPAPTWRIVLVSLEQNNKPLGLIIDSEITIGRTAGDATPDLDLTPFGASIKGVSRIHARLRPSVNSLVLIDNNSSNGTYCNRSRIAPNAEQPLKEGDVIAFGQAYFLVRVVKSPDTTGTKTLI